ncbi:MAG TPA: succinate dehydrogenase [Rubricoccaceae bacterium]|jgi:succinate dehydrogenase / fumarate reductase membrane anchor subunit
MATTYGKGSQSSAVQWFAHRITGTFLVFLLITHFWVQHYSRVTASVSHSVISADGAHAGELPEYSEEAEAAVRAARTRTGGPQPERSRAVTVAFQGERSDGTAPGPTHPPAETDAITPYDVLMLRLGDPVYAVLWKGFNLLFLLFALHHGFYGLNNIMTDYIRNDLLRAGASALSWTIALVLFVIGAYAVIVAGL